MGIFDEFYRPSRVQIDDPEYPGAFARSYSRQMCSTTTISIMLCGAVLVIFGSWFVWYQYTSCGVFCVRLDGPQHTGEAHCPDGIPQTLGADGSVDATFEARLLEVADDIHVNHRIVLSTIWLPDGLIWSYYFKPHTLVLNFLMQLQEHAPNLHPLIVCVTDYTCQVLRTFHADLNGGFTVYEDNSHFNCEADKYLVRAFNLKYLYAYTLLKNGYDVLMTDSDTAFLGDPFPALVEGRADGIAPDIQALSDSSVDVEAQQHYFAIPRPVRLAKPWEHIPGCIVDYPVTEVNYCISSGLVMWYSTPAALQVAQALALEMDTNQGRWEQLALNVNMESAIRVGQVSFELMPGDRFNNMNAWINLETQNATQVQRDRWLVAHAGGQHGPTDKIATFKRLDLWKIPMVLPIKIK